MELQYLQEFKTLVDSGSYTKAARELFISQPALSKHIASLEKEIGYSLLNRTSRSLRLTEEGKILYERASNILEEYAIMEDELARIHHFNFGSLNMASKAMQTHFGISDFLHFFRQKYPNILVNIDDSSLGQPDPFISEDIELAFTHLIKGSGKAYEYQLFLRDQLAVIMPASHPLAQADTVTFQQLKDETFICIDDDIEALCLRLGKECAFEPHIYRLRNTYIDSAYEYVRWKAGICISSHQLFNDIATKDCVAVDLEPKIPHDMYLAKRANARLSKEASLFWNFLREHKRS